MEGEWRAATGRGSGGAARRSRRAVVIETPTAVAVGFDLGVVEVFPAAEEADRRPPRPRPARPRLGRRRGRAPPRRRARRADRGRAPRPAQPRRVRQRVRQRAVLPARHPAPPGRRARSTAAARRPRAPDDPRQSRPDRAHDDGRRPPRASALGLRARRRAVPSLRHAHRARRGWAATSWSCATPGGARAASDDAAARRRSRARLADRAGPLLAGALADRVGDRRCLAERELNRAQPVAQRARVVVADLGGAGGDEAGEGVDELARLVEVDLLASGSSARPNFTAAALIRCTAAVLMTSTAGTSAMSRVAPSTCLRPRRLESARLCSLLTDPLLY